MSAYSRHPLPFPVRSTEDLRRAITVADDDATRRFVVQRARALGHTDLIPSSWRLLHRVRQPEPETLDTQFDQIAEQYSIGVTKLKAIYLRGVREFAASSDATGSATMYGLARVQRFVNALANGSPLTADEDMLEQEATPAQDPGVEITIDTSALVHDVIYSYGARTAELFHPGHVMAISLDESELCVAGSLDDMRWTYVLNIESGAQELKIS